MKIQYNQIIGQPSSPRNFCDHCCFPNCIPVDLYECVVVKSFKRSSADIFNYENSAK